MNEQKMNENKRVVKNIQAILSWAAWDDWRNNFPLIIMHSDNGVHIAYSIGIKFYALIKLVHMNTNFNTLTSLERVGGFECVENEKP